MRALIGSSGCEFLQGTLLSELVMAYEKKLENDAMIKAVKMKTGKSFLVFIVNGEVIGAEKYDSIQLKDGDDVRIQHPYFGG
jgi:sulfur carrier protein ThiS